eukprot:CAMPEP_0194672040 /NCGR_PEP_ID=MMETSP0295-20121207/6196_1 /TAXON_ID=39354 /ORGANISM="Heterosigma akashiwo, Strain CCMP2393" /LENGTH=53 /DNA_ID=CAMNT_0039555649 /DNA_START=503 /DNA_END=660 /DNA_ORIENTATION=-
MAQAAVKLVLELAAPDGFPARAVAQWVARLYHEALDDPMEDQSIIVPAAAVLG